MGSVPAGFSLDVDGIPPVSFGEGRESVDSFDVGITPPQIKNRLFSANCTNNQLSLYINLK